MTPIGLNTFDLLEELPLHERTVIRALLRYSQLTEDALFKALPKGREMSRNEMQKALKGLVQKEWVFEIKEKGQKAYTIKQQKHH